MASACSDLFCSCHLFNSRKIVKTVFWNTFLDTFWDISLKFHQYDFAYGACGPLTKTNERVKKN